MKRQLKNLSSKGIMETGNHFKNGVNLQNLSSRGIMETGDSFRLSGQSVCKAAASRDKTEVTESLK
ncbi:MAG: hypothetical protein LBC19_16775 [Tannerella sp.]|jgi:hypothetical protein|nr:hypothetical protein [Tannerella sp.]